MNEADLSRISAPTQIIWGTNDPLGGVDVAKAVAAQLQDSRLKILDAGRGPWFGHPSEVARIVSEFGAE
jgi:pimeloyl-ACP methyl ester carboxylesterase